MNTMARQLRKNQTPAEEKLWFYLRGRRLSGLKFRRQYPIGPFVTDFCCFDRKLLVEIDGDVHFTESQPERDEARQRFLERLGYQVIRVTNLDIAQNLEGVLEIIRLAAFSVTP